MPKNQPYRQLFFLYMWAESSEDLVHPRAWRYRVEDALTHEQHLFTQLSAVAEFLETKKDLTLQSVANGEHPSSPSGQQPKEEAQ